MEFSDMHVIFHALAYLARKAILSYNNEDSAAS